MTLDHHKRNFAVSLEGCAVRAYKARTYAKLLECMKQVEELCKRMQQECERSKTS